MTSFNASVVLGGTGMLATATRWLAERSGQTLVIARHATHFVGPPSVIPVDADWNHASFADVAEAALERLASPQAALLWLHEPEGTLPWLIRRLPSARVVLVLGSMDGQPAIPAGAAHRLVTVRLGSVATPRGRRWLTHGEISAAAITALKDGRSRVVGELAPAG